MMAKPGLIFISYRRSDSITVAGRIYDKLASMYGPDRVFKDVDDIPYGVNFVNQLEQAVAECNVLITLIGQNWIDVSDEQGNRRLDNPNDFVRIEIASALTRDILVLPVLVNGATMPTRTKLPENLQALTQRNAARVRYDPDFHNDMERIIDDLEEYFRKRGLATARKRNVQPTSAYSRKRSLSRASLVVTVISGINGLIFLCEWLIFFTPLSLLASAALFTSVIALMRDLQWGRKCTIAAQIFILIGCGLIIEEVFISPYFISPSADVLLFMAVIASTLLALILLLISKPQRS